MNKSVNSLNEIVKSLIDVRQKLESKISNHIDKQQNDWNGKELNAFKEIINHITYWDYEGTKWINQIRENKTPEFPWKTASSIKTIREIQAEINKKLTNKSRNKSLDEILKSFRDSYTKLLTTIQILTEDQLHRQINVSWRTEPIPVEDIVNWRRNHYVSHLKDLDILFKNIQF